MALFGFAINFTNGATDYVIASGVTEDQARASVCRAVEDCSGGGVESVEAIDAEEIVSEQYDDCAILSTQFGGC